MHLRTGFLEERFPLSKRLPLTSSGGRVMRVVHGLSACNPRATGHPPSLLSPASHMPFTLDLSPTARRRAQRRHGESRNAEQRNRGAEDQREEKKRDEKGENARERMSGHMANEKEGGTIVCSRPLSEVLAHGSPAATAAPHPTRRRLLRQSDVRLNHALQPSETSWCAAIPSFLSSLTMLIASSRLLRRTHWMTRRLRGSGVRGSMSFHDGPVRPMRRGRITPIVRRLSHVGRGWVPLVSSRRIRPQKRSGLLCVRRISTRSKGLRPGASVKRLSRGRDWSLGKEGDRSK
eukprot:scaffold295_cov257-Pinguiococcus_pyrenoidosus.AAC.9